MLNGQSETDRENSKKIIAFLRLENNIGFYSTVLKRCERTKCSVRKHGRQQELMNFRVFWQHNIVYH